MTKVGVRVNDRVGVRVGVRVRVTVRLAVMISGPLRDDPRQLCHFEFLLLPGEHTP